MFSRNSTEVSSQNSRGVLCENSPEVHSRNHPGDSGESQRFNSWNNSQKELSEESLESPEEILRRNL